jgi:hypothetical protein
MKYVLLIHHDEDVWDKMSESDRQPILLEFRKLRHELSTSGNYLDGAPCTPRPRPPASACATAGGC